MFIPHTDQETKEMLEVVGVKDIESLFKDIPKKYRFPKLNLPPAMTEMEIMAEMQNISQANESTQDLVCFLGAGVYNHYTPAAVDMLLRRGEFYTAYTPYQPEISQGTLQVIFEFQSLITALTGMEASNASHYDGATATAEAVIMAYQNFRGKKNKVILSPTLNPQYRAVARTYTQGYDNLIITGDTSSNPSGEPAALIDQLDDQTALVIVQYPDFLGNIFDYTELIAKAHEIGALVAVAVNPVALGMLKTPGEMGADIVVGEGQPLGLPLSYGGPYLGIFATKKEYIRKISGRLVGETVDGKGNRAYVLTLTAREQHIRREKASSNICTNQGLLALAATIHLSLLGKHGLKKVAELNYHKAHYAAEKIAAIPGYSVCIDHPYFNEFVVCCPAPAREINAHLLDHGILGGYELEKDYPEMENHLLVAVTEMNTKDEIDMLCEVLAEVDHE
jgi:glycine dehydrogenase subunit 1